MCPLYSRHEDHQCTVFVLTCQYSQPEQRYNSRVDEQNVYSATYLQPVSTPASSEFNTLRQLYQQYVSVSITVRPGVYPLSTSYPSEPGACRVPTEYAALGSPFDTPVMSSVNVQHAPYPAPVNPYIRAVSDHVIRQEITSQCTEPFAGDAVDFWA